ncbi:MAG: murein L,D-transpeptidase family protein [Gammaproteobacteria bacterium]
MGSRLRVWAGALAMAVAASAYTGTAGAQYEIEINKSRRELLVKDGAKVERRYRIAVGRGGKGDKLETGDKRTPIGRYRILDINDSSRYHLFMHLNYPNVKDAFYGLKNKVISRGEFDRIVEALRHGRPPPQNTRLGGRIGIHGIGETNEEKLRLHRALDWTLGCIALTNDEVAELRNFVHPGTLVVISE